MMEGTPIYHNFPNDPPKTSFSFFFTRNASPVFLEWKTSREEVFVGVQVSKAWRR